MEGYQNVFQDIQQNGSREEDCESDDFRSAIADNQDEAIGSMGPVSFTWKSPTKLAPVPSVFESYQGVPKREEKGRETAKDGVWKELEINKIPADIADKYASVTVKPKKKQEKKPQAFHAWRASGSSDFVPPKRHAPPPPLTNAWEQKPGKHLFEPISRSSSVSSGELDDVRKAMQNSLTTLEDDAERRRRNYIKMFGDPDISEIKARRYWNMRSEPEEEQHYSTLDTHEDWDACIPQPKKPEPVAKPKSKHVHIPPGLPPRLQKQALAKQKLTEMGRGKVDQWSQNSFVTEQKSEETTLSLEFSELNFKSEQSVPNPVENPKLQDKERAFVPLSDTEFADTNWNTPKPQVEQVAFDRKVVLESRAQFLQPEAKQSHVNELFQPSGSNFLPLKNENRPESHARLRQPQVKEAHANKIPPPPGFSFQPPAPPQVRPDLLAGSISSSRREPENQGINLSILERHEGVSHTSRRELSLAGRVKNPKPREVNDRPVSPSDFFVANSDTGPAVGTDTKNDLTNFLSPEQLAKLSQALEIFPEIDDQVVAALIEVMFPDVVAKVRSHAQAKLRAQASQLFPVYENELVRSAAHPFPDYPFNLAALQPTTQMPLSVSNVALYSSLGTMQNAFPQFAQQYLLGAHNMSPAPMASQFQPMSAYPVPSMNFEQEREMLMARLAALSADGNSTVLK